ncbi:MAG TPA: hypothetical protein PLL95_05870, partial [Anaerolineales bacterium]|nr:hypothetical protein [Anaerolineales bacterium]
YPEYVKIEDGTLLSPHKSLPPLEIAGKDAVVNEGTGAITAYQAMLYGPQEMREQWKHLLLEYCKLDTLAMVMIYQHWLEKLR